MLNIRASILISCIFLSFQCTRIPLINSSKGDAFLVYNRVCNERSIVLISFINRGRSAPRIIRSDTLPIGSKSYPNVVQVNSITRSTIEEYLAFDQELQRLKNGYRAVFSLRFRSQDRHELPLCDSLHKAVVPQIKIKNIRVGAMRF